jgi:putative FmdB family regulatory protein
VPLYDYVCSSCGHTMEVSHSIHGSGPSACPECGGPMKKALSAPAVHFKGSGWARKERSGGSRPAKSNETVPSDAETAASVPAEPGASKPDSAIE